MRPLFREERTKTGAVKAFQGLNQTPPMPKAQRPRAPWSCCFHFLQRDHPARRAQAGEEGRRPLKEPALHRVWSACGWAGDSLLSEPLGNVWLPWPFPFSSSPAQRTCPATYFLKAQPGALGPDTPALSPRHHAWSRSVPAPLTPSHTRTHSSHYPLGPCHPVCPHGAPLPPF